MKLSEAIKASLAQGMIPGTGYVLCNCSCLPAIHGCAIGLAAATLLGGPHQVIGMLGPSIMWKDRLFPAILPHLPGETYESLDQAESTFERDPDDADTAIQNLITALEAQGR